jgi:3-hydroxy-9,10-secoandrosta-1,3,5(10)-triene-9,17-dione monooxygenase
MTAAPTYDTLLANARALVPRLIARAAETERLRRLPDATYADFLEAGLWAAYRPARYGGAEIPIRGVVELAAILGSGCGSTSWVFNNLVAHSWMAGYWPEAAQDDIWRDTPDALIGSGLVMSSGRARAVEGGYRLSGRWPFSSGIDISPWVLLGGFAENQEPRFYLVPRAEMRVIDTWYVMGLAGTGSKDVAVDDVFVPAHRSLPATAGRGGPHPGSKINPGPLFRLPWYPLFSFVTAGTSLGIAQGAVRDFAAAMRDRAATYSGRLLADLPTLQLRIAEAATLADAAEAVLLKDCDEADALAAADELPDMEARTRWRRDGAYAAQFAARAVDLVFAGSGGGAIHAEHPLQRALRDIHAANGHIGVSWDLNGALFGQVALGLTPEFSLL